MNRILAVLLLGVVAFAGGLYFERVTSDRAGGSGRQLDVLESENESLLRRNRELRDTLELVKRQIQTDRIAYQALRESVESSDAERAELKRQLENQRRLLKVLREKLSALEGG